MDFGKKYETVKSHALAIYDSNSRYFLHTMNKIKETQLCYKFVVKIF